MKSVWNSFVATYNETPPNAFKLVNYSRTNPQLHTLTYHEAKQLMDKHSSSLLSPQQPMRRHNSTNTQHVKRLKRRQSNHFKPRKISQNKQQKTHEKHQRGGSNKFNLSKRTYSFKKPAKPSKPLKPLLHQSSSSASTSTSTDSDTTDVTDKDIANNAQRQTQTQTEKNKSSSPLPLHIKSRSHSNSNLKSKLTKTRKSEYITPKSQTPRHRNKNKNNSLHFAKNKDNKIVLPRLGIVKKSGTLKAKRKNPKREDIEQEKRRNPNKKKRKAVKAAPPSSASAKNKISIDFQRKKKKKGKLMKPKAININDINAQRTHAQSQGMQSELCKRPMTGRGASHLTVGDHVLLTQDREGVVLYIGAVHFAKGIWFGLELINGSIGTHDGIIGHKRYFTSAPKRGLFVQSSKIRRKIRQSDFNSSPRLRRHHSLELMMKLAASGSGGDNKPQMKQKKRRRKAADPRGHNASLNTQYDGEPIDDDDISYALPSQSTPVLQFSDSRLATASPIHVQPVQRASSGYSYGTNQSSNSSTSTTTTATTSTHHTNHSRHSAHYGHQNEDNVHGQAQPHNAMALPIYNGARHSYRGHADNDHDAHKHHVYSHRNTGTTPVPAQFDELQLSTKSVPATHNMSGLDIIALKSLLRSEIESEFQTKFDELKQILMDKSETTEHNKKSRKSKKRTRKKKRRKKSKRKKKLKEKEKKTLDKLKKMERRRRTKSKTTAEQLKKSEELISCSSKSDKSHLCVDNNHIQTEMNENDNENESDDYQKNSDLNITTHSEYTEEDENVNENENGDEYEDEEDEEEEQEEEEAEDEIAEFTIFTPREHTHGRNISLVSNSSADGFDGLTPTSVQMTDVSDFDLDDIRYHVTKQLQPRKHFWGTK